MKNFLYGILLIFLLSGSVNGQEILGGLSVNPVIIEKIQKMSGQNSGTTDSHLKLLNDTTPVLLPFVDDFSANGIFPSGRRWIDRYAFENDDYPILPVNIGCVTLDAVNDSGRMYPDATPGPASFIADHLTSRYIRLDSAFTPVPRKLSPQDSVYLSFWFQPQGRGRAPQFNDSLILQFLLKPAYDSLIPGGGIINVPDKWQQVWFSNGTSLDTFYVKNNRWFARVMIPVTDPLFFTPKFRFRFFNYVSLASAAEPSWQSNCDMWNIDQVYLNAGRNQYDSIYPELRFISKPSNLLKNYAEMPYPHYCNDPTNELRDSLLVLMSNRDITPKMSSYKYFITQPGATYSKVYDGGNYNIQPFNVSPYVTYPKFARPDMPFLLPVGTNDSASFLIRHILRENAAVSTLGDTVDYFLHLYNYFAYDDGTPEASYGLTPKGSKLAYRFKLNKSPDTLRAVRFYFNQTLSPADERLFHLCVWNDNTGKPGDTIYSAIVYPKYADSLNKFVTYHLDPPISVTGTFYVGFIQTTNDNLSIGFDRNNNSQQEIFFNTGGTWINSSFAGSLLIRPVVGKPIPLGNNGIPTGKESLKIYPNPCREGTLYLQVKGSNGTAALKYRITDLVGHLRAEGNYTSGIHVSDFTPGLYIIEVNINDDPRPLRSRFIISR